MSEAPLSAALAMAREQILIAPHHPDRLRRPPARPGAIESDRFHQALLWTIFRTFAARNVRDVARACLNQLSDGCGSLSD